MLAEKLAEEGHEVQGGSAGSSRLHWTQSSTTAPAKRFNQLKIGGETTEKMAGGQKLSMVGCSCIMMAGRSTMPENIAKLCDGGPWDTLGGGERFAGLARFGSGGQLDADAD